MKLILFFLLIVFPVHAQAACVILLHGLARTDSSMKKLESELLKENFRPINVKYPSREDAIEVLAEETIPPALAQCSPEEEVNFVTHSMGGILVRQYLSQHEITNLNHVVMLGPPNKGSEVVDKLGDFPGFHFLNGDAGMQLGTGEMSVPNKLGKANFDVGIIAGTRSINLILSMLIPSTDDGKISIERTKLEGMHDHLEMPVTHPFMMKNDDVIAQVIYYLKNGTFKRDNNHIQSNTHD
ncbi:MAG: alpha/beta hydrolase [Proteobacteria bacterium]|nr:alpha/beta hydrolase [Pseudomonadota bacterium]MBU1640369.1 alpha/beta hydrolase [Pseudomonadota bacterium]